MQVWSPLMFMHQLQLILPHNRHSPMGRAKGLMLRMPQFLQYSVAFGSFVVSAHRTWRVGEVLFMLQMGF